MDSQEHRPLVVPRLLPAWLFAAVALQIATVAAGSTEATPAPGWTVLAGCALAGSVAGVQYRRLRLLNGPGHGRVINRILGGTGARVSSIYVLALGGAIWAASVHAWWLVAGAAVLGGAAFAAGSAAPGRRG